MNTMEPNQPHYSIDYLNEIAPSQRRSLGNDKLFFAIIIGALLIALLMGVFFLTRGGESNTQQTQNLSARLQTLQKIATNANQKNAIKSNELKGINANLLTQLTNANQKITEPLEKSSGKTELPKNIVSANAETDLQATLEDARLNAVFDRVYSINMSYQLQSLLLQMQTLDNRTKNQSLKSYLVSTKKNLQPIEKQFTQFANESS